MLQWSNPAGALVAVQQSKRHTKCSQLCVPCFYWTNKYPTVSTLVHSNRRQMIKYENAAILQHKQLKLKTLQQKYTNILLE